MADRKGGARDNQLNVRLSDAGWELVGLLQEYHGLSQASVIEMLLRQEARHCNIPIPGSGLDALLRQLKEHQADHH